MTMAKNKRTFIRFDWALKHLLRESMKDDGMSVGLITKYTGLSVEEIEAL